MTQNDLHRHVGRYYGKYAGVVTDVQDPQKQGRVWVKVPSVLGEDTTVLARPCFPAAHFYVPPVEATVWVEFEAGDPRYPIWAGVWYTEDAVPDPAKISPPDSRLIKTPSGHSIEMLDKDGEEKIVITHKQNSTITLDKDGNIAIANKNGVKIELKDSDVNVTSSSGTVTVKGSTVVLDGASSVQAGANAMEPTILGQTFLSMYNSHTHATALGPSGPPIPPLTPAALTTIAKVK